VDGSKEKVEREARILGEEKDWKEIPGFMCVASRRERSHSFLVK
jgi:hypothetical protein